MNNFNKFVLVNVLFIFSNLITISPSGDHKISLDEAYKKLVKSHKNNDDKTKKALNRTKFDAMAKNYLNKHQELLQQNNCDSVKSVKCQELLGEQQRVLNAMEDVKNIYS